MDRADTRRMKNQCSFQLVLLPAKEPSFEGQNLYRAAFDLWHGVWSKTLKELDGQEKTFSDGFTRQDFFAGLFQEDTCVALVMFKKIDLRFEIHWRDSWFASWDKSTLKEISEESPVCMVPSWLTVHPLFRKNSGRSDARLSTVITEVMAQMCIEMKADVGFGTSRNNRGVNKLVYHAGAIPLEKGRIAHGVEVDLVAFFPEKIEQAKQNFSSLFFDVWEGRKVIGRIDEIQRSDNERHLQEAS